MAKLKFKNGSEWITFDNDDAIVDLSSDPTSLPNNELGLLRTNIIYRYGGKLYYWTGTVIEEIGSNKVKIIDENKGMEEIDKKEVFIISTDDNLTSDEEFLNNFFEIDAKPTENSTNLINSGAVYESLNSKLNKAPDTSENSVYGIYSKQQKMIKLDYANYASVNAIPQRGTPDGAIYIRDSSLVGDGNVPIGLRAVNKNYVDNAIARAHGELKHTTLEWSKNLATQFQVDLGVYISPSMPVIPQEFQLYGIGGYTLYSGNYSSNGPAINELSFSINEFTITLRSYYPGGADAGTTTAQFHIDDYTLNGTVATFTLTPNDFGPDGGIFTFDCIPHSPNN